MPKFPKNTGFKLEGFPFPGDKYDVKESNINGEGSFAKKNIKSGELIGTAIYHAGKDPAIEGSMTALGNKTNHQFNNNSVLRKDGEDYSLYASRDITKNSEITVNYKDTPPWVDKDTTGFKEV